MNTLLFLFWSAATASAALVNAVPADGWTAFSIETRQPVSVSCDYCRIDGDGISIERHDADDIGPAGESQLNVYAELRGGVVERVRVFSPSCALDTAGHTIHWVRNVSQAESIAFLRDAVEHGTRKGRRGAMLALSLEAGTTDTLIDLARRNPDGDVRGTALFWLSQQAGEKAAAALKDAVQNDPEESVRARAVFGISQLPDDESIPLLIDLMKNNHSRAVRRKAAFWLGQKKDPRALAAIEDLLR